MERVKVAIMGLGGRGKDAYASYLKRAKEEIELVAIADPIEAKRKAVAEEFGILEVNCYESGEEFLQQEKMADVLFICTQDKQHVGHAIPALKKGYHIILEKPISPDLKECEELLRTANEYQREVIVCHVLRYTPFYSKLKEILDEGVIGEILHVQANENVGYWHQAHSYVRGNWRREDDSSPMILAKCCHDMDILLWLTGKHCEKVSSFGKLSLFCEAKAPKGAAKRCLDGCKVKDSCPYDAQKIYLTNQETGLLKGNSSWPVNIVAFQPTEEKVREALETGPYGRCVYHCDNTVVDHQTVHMQLEGGITVSFTMCGVTKDVSRSIRVMGSSGELVGDMEGNLITITLFGQEPQVIDIRDFATDFSGHGGGDSRMVKEFLEKIINKEEASKTLTTLERSMESHYVALAAEDSRKQQGAVVTLQEYREKFL